MATFPAGKIILFEEGEYSDFGYCGQVVTLKEVNINELIEAYKAQYTKKSERYYDGPDPSGFVAWLCLNQIVAPLECDTVYLGAYGDLTYKG